MKSIDNGVSKSDFAYNARHELTSETQTLAGRPARTVSYKYDADGLRSDIVYPSAKIVELAWTARAQLAAVTADGPPPFANYTYDKAGRVTAVIHENGITESKSYNAAGELLANLHLQGGSAVNGHTYTLDATGRRTAEVRSGDLTVTSSYGYDATNQVVSADYGNSLADAYDPMGNRTSANVASQGGTNTTYTSNSANQYTSITGLTPISHDANGNLLQQNDVIYTKDSENRLLSVTPALPALGSKALVHTYDGQARRVTRSIREWTAGGWNVTETIQFIYDGWNVIEEHALGGGGTTLVRNFTWGQDLGGSTTLQAAGGVGGLLLAEEFTGSTTTAYHFHYDGNGNVTKIADLVGTTVASYRYDAFGNTLAATGSYAAQNRYRFSTKPLDSEVTNAPLYYYGYRYYDPTTGRWPSRDPIEEIGGINLYGFVGNQALSKIDFLGNLSFEQNTTLGGCIPLAPGVAFCIAGGWSVENSPCCSDDGTKKRYTIASGNVEVFLQFGSFLPYTVSITKGLDLSPDPLPTCPDGVEPEACVKVGINVGQINGECSWCVEGGLSCDVIGVRLRPGCLILRGILGFACPGRRVSGLDRRRLSLPGRVL